MSNDDLTDCIGVDKTEVEDEWDEMVVENDGLEVKVDRNERPGQEVREKAVEGRDGVFVVFPASLHYV